MKFMPPFVYQFDDVTVSLIPSGAKAVLGYSDGTYANKAQMAAAFPHALQTYLTVHGTDFEADGVDSERGDADTAAVIAFLHEKKSQGKRGIAYTFLANMRAMHDAILNSGLKHDEVIWFCAHVTGEPHICGPQCGFGLDFTVDATQYTFTAEGKSLDESLCAPGYFDRSLVPPVPPDPHHYQRFGKYREAVKLYDEKRRHRIKNRKELATLEAYLLHAAEVDAAHVIHEAPVAGSAARKAAWRKDDRGWRYQQFIHRANGKRVVK